MTAHEYRLLCAEWLKRALGYRVHDLVKMIYFRGVTGLAHGMARVRRFSRTSGRGFPCKLAACCIVKNESRYLKEWIEFHRLVGIEQFYIYDNGSDDGSCELLAPYVASGVVVYTWFPGDKMQLPAYEDCIEKHYNDCEWLAFFDVDEFIYPCSNASIPEVLAGMQSDVAQVLVNERYFGSGGARTYDDRPVVERFASCGALLNIGKGLVKPRRVWAMEVHEHYVSGRTEIVPETLLRLNHYHCKSQEEYSAKKSKGDVFWGRTASAPAYDDAYFAAHDANDYEDRSIQRYLPALLKRLEK